MHTKLASVDISKLHLPEEVPLVKSLDKPLVPAESLSEVKKEQIKAVAIEEPKPSNSTNYISDNELDSQSKSSVNNKFTSSLNAIRGKTFWIKANPEASSRIKFIEPNSDGNVPKYSQEKVFYVKADANFIVIDSAKGDYDTFLKVKFSDEKIGYLQINPLSSIDPDSYPLIDNLYPGKDADLVYFEYIFSRPPQEAFAAERKAAAIQKEKQAKKDAAWKARGGVRIGMTKEQVKNSNWGRPNSINRSTGSFGTHEQWIYGGGNYLYFDNGVLTSIQN